MHNERDLDEWELGPDEDSQLEAVLDPLVEEYFRQEATLAKVLAQLAFDREEQRLREPGTDDNREPDRQQYAIMEYHAFDGDLMLWIVPVVMATDLPAGFASAVLVDGRFELEEAAPDRQQNPASGAGAVAKRYRVVVLLGVVLLLGLISFIPTDTILLHGSPGSPSAVNAPKSTAVATALPAATPGPLLGAQVSEAAILAVGTNASPASPTPISTVGGAPPSTTLSATVTAPSTETPPATAPAAAGAAEESAPAANANPNPVQTGVITNTDGKGAWLRAKPSPQAEQLVVIREGDGVDILGSSVGMDGISWDRVAYQSLQGRLVGWVSREFLEPLNPVLPFKPSSASRGERIVEAVKAHLQTPWRAGGSMPSGWDNIGFVRYIYRTITGLLLPHNLDQLSTYGTWVAREQIEPGDIIYFYAENGDRGVAHCAIAVGAGAFIHVPNPEDGTVVGRLDNPYWGDRYAWSRRP